MNKQIFLDKFRIKIWSELGSQGKKGTQKDAGILFLCSQSTISDTLKGNIDPTPDMLVWAAREGHVFEHVIETKEKFIERPIK